jgi:hypothetical protein
VTDNTPRCTIGNEPLTLAEAGRYACLACTETLRRRLREIELYATIMSNLKGPARRGTERRAPGYTSTAPVNLDILVAFDPRSALAADRDPDPVTDDEEPIRYLWGEIGSMARMVAEERDEPDPGAALWYLLVHADWCAYQPWIDEHATTVADLHRQVRSLARDSPPPKIGDCMMVGCDGEVHWTRDRAIRNDDGTEQTLDCGRCRGCGELYYGVRLVRLKAAAA